MDLYEEKLDDLKTLSRDLTVLYENIYNSLKNRLNRGEVIDKEEKSQILRLINRGDIFIQRMAMVEHEKLYKMERLLQ